MKNWGLFLKRGKNDKKIIEKIAKILYYKIRNY